jgi:hypothetical protein
MLLQALFPSGRRLEAPVTKQGMGGVGRPRPGNLPSRKGLITWKLVLQSGNDGEPRPYDTRATRPPIGGTTISCRNKNIVVRAPEMATFLSGFFGNGCSCGLREACCCAWPKLRCGRSRGRARNTTLMSVSSLGHHGRVSGPFPPRASLLGHSSFRRLLKNPRMLTPSGLRQFSALAMSPSWSVAPRLRPALGSLRSSEN